MLFYDPSIYSVYIQLVDEGLSSDSIAVITSYYLAIAIWQLSDPCPEKKALRGSTMLECTTGVFYKIQDIVAPAMDIVTNHDSRMEE